MYAKRYRLMTAMSMSEVARVVWKYIEIVGESPESFANAVRDAITEAGKTVRGMEWFEVSCFRGTISKDKVKNFQAVVKIGFTVER
jgi:flavin-binding protein dodecin